MRDEHIETEDAVLSSIESDCISSDRTCGTAVIRSPWSCHMEACLYAFRDRRSTCREADRQGDVDAVMRNVYPRAALRADVPGARFAVVSQSTVTA